jgi:hypothetical protein
MKDFFLKLPKKIWTALVILFCALGDISILKVIYDKLSPYSYFKEIIELSTKISKAPIRLPEADLKALHQIMIRNLELMILAVIGFHTVIYFLYFLEKKIARSYLVGLTLSAGICCVVAGGQSFLVRGVNLESYLFIQGILYLLVGIGLLYRKDGQNKLSAGVSGPSSGLT